MKGVVFTTSLSTKQCADVFREATERTRTPLVKLFEFLAKTGGSGDVLGYYTPNTDSPFASVDGKPDFAVGINILRSRGARVGNATAIHMYIQESETARIVQLAANHTMIRGFTGGLKAARLVSAFLGTFQANDPSLQIIDGNVGNRDGR